VCKILPVIKEPENIGAKYGPIGSNRNHNYFPSIGRSANMEPYRVTGGYYIQQNYSTSFEELWLANNKYVHYTEYLPANECQGTSTFTYNDNNACSCPNNCPMHHKSTLKYADCPPPYVAQSSSFNLRPSKLKNPSSSISRNKSKSYDESSSIWNHINSSNVSMVELQRERHRITQEHYRNKVKPGADMNEKLGDSENMSMVSSRANDLSEYCSPLKTKKRIGNIEIMHNTTQSSLISNHLQQIATEGINEIYNSKNIWSFDAMAPWASPPSIASTTLCSNLNVQML
jgi:hypothetical protein